MIGDQDTLRTRITERVVHDIVPLIRGGRYGPLANLVASLSNGTDVLSFPSILVCLYICYLVRCNLITTIGHPAARPVQQCADRRYHGVVYTLIDRTLQGRARSVPEVHAFRDDQMGSHLCMLSPYFLL